MRVESWCYPVCGVACGCSVGDGKLHEVNAQFVFLRGLKFLSSEGWLSDKSSGQLLVWQLVWEAAKQAFSHNLQGYKVIRDQSDEWFYQRASNKATLDRCFFMFVLSSYPLLYSVFCSFGQEQLINLLEFCLSSSRLLLMGHLNKDFCLKARGMAGTWYLWVLHRDIKNHFLFEQSDSESAFSLLWLLHGLSVLHNSWAVGV